MFYPLIDIAVRASYDLPVEIKITNKELLIKVQYP